MDFDAVNLNEPLRNVKRKMNNSLILYVCVFWGVGGEVNNDSVQIQQTHCR